MSFYRKSIESSLLCASLLCGASGWVFGSVLFVDIDGACQGQAPCYLSVSEAVDAAASGDSVHVFPGTYTEAVVIDRPLVLRAATQTRPTIVAPWTPGSSGVGSNAIRIRSSDVEVNGLDLQAHNDVVVVELGTGNYTPCSSPLSNVEIKNNVVETLLPIVDVKATGVFACFVDNLTIARNRVRNSAGALGVGIYLGVLGAPVTNSTIIRNAVENTQSTGVLVGVGNGVTITQNNVAHAGQYAGDGTLSGDGSGIKIGAGANYNVIYYNRVSNSREHGIYAVEYAGGAGRNIIVLNNSSSSGGYDICDDQLPPSCHNIWLQNLFGTSFGCAARVSHGSATPVGEKDTPLMAFNSH